MEFFFKLCLYLTFSAVIPLSASLMPSSFSTLQPSCLDHEKSALLQFKSNFQTNCSASVDPIGHYASIPKMKSWIDGINANCCSWEGVECNKETGHVISLNLSSSCLLGTFPSNSTLFSLVHLEALRLSFNNFNRSRVPSQLGQLQKLKHLNLFGSSFSGKIPTEISKLSELTTLFLGKYENDGIPNLKFEDFSLEKLVQNLTRLQYIHVMNVDIFSTVPIILTNLTSLIHITLTFGNLYGKIPPNIFHLPHLEILDLGGNQDLYGSLPEFQHHSPLEQIHLYGTSISGTLPPSIGRLACLEFFMAYSCQFSGSIPSTLGNLTNLIILSLYGNSFSGVIPTSISNLTNLEELLLSNNAVVPGEFVSKLGMLSKLESLSLSGVSLGIQYPSFLANLTRLTELDLENIKGGGPLPQWLANLTQLNTLILGGSSLVGPIPTWFSNLTNLQALRLQGNNLSASFEIFANLEYLAYLDLPGVKISFPPNNMTKSSPYKLSVLKLPSCSLTKFPEFLSNQDELQFVDLSQNHIQGVIPQWFVSLTRISLLYLDLSANNLTGFEQPVEVLPWTKLGYLDISGNNFQGSLLLPSAYSQLYDASNNQFSGDIPKQFCSAQSLVKLDLSNNNLSGCIPHCIGAHLGNSLNLLNLKSNNFHGHIPPTFGTSCKLKMINLSQNQLKGQLPRSLANCTRLEVLDIGHNYVNDVFPSWMRRMPNMQVLVLRNNELYGSITDQNAEQCLHNLRIIDVSSNFLSGKLPSNCFQNWRNMMVTKEDQAGSFYTGVTYFFGLLPHPLTETFDHEYIITITNKGTERLFSKVLSVFRVVDFSNNKFSGTIPHIIGTLKGLQALNLSNNNLEGMIPPSLANMIDLESLDLSKNMLSGTIPPELSHITSLEVFDISYNSLQGPIPQGNQFDTFDNSSYEGNPELCGKPLSQECGKVDVPQSPTTSGESDEDSEWIDWVIRASGCLGGFIVGYVIGKLYITDKYHEWFTETFQRKPKRRVRRASRQRR